MLMLTQADARKIPLVDKSVHMIVTSPPFWNLRDYNIDGQLGLEATPEEYVAKMVEAFREVWRVLRDDGTAWVNLGDSYASGGRGSSRHHRQKMGEGTSNAQALGRKRPPEGLKDKDLVGIPWRIAFALQADGWYLRADIIWSKKNCMPESVTDRPTKSHEYLFLLSKKKRYFYDADAIREPHSSIGQVKPQIRQVTSQKWSNNLQTKHGNLSTLKSHNDPSLYHPVGRNRRSVWTIATQGFKGAHFATYPPALVEPCIKAGTSERGVCPECGSPWRRVTEKEFVLQEDVSAAKVVRGHDGTKRQPNDGWDGFPRGATKSTTTGWQPTCTCGAGEPVKAIILDPFVGSGTTLQVARQLGRHGIGLDLSYTYLHDQARHRLELDALDEWTNGKPATGSLDGLPLFAERIKQ